MSQFENPIPSHEIKAHRGIGFASRIALRGFAESIWNPNLAEAFKALESIQKRKASDGQTDRQIRIFRSRLSTFSQSALYMIHIMNFKISRLLQSVTVRPSDHPSVRCSAFALSGLLQPLRERTNELSLSKLSFLPPSDRSGRKAGRSIGRSIGANAPKPFPLLM